MTTVFLSPILNGWQSFLASGAVNNGGFVNVYQAGTTTPATSYTSSAGNVATANPIPLNAAGVPPYEIWLVQGQAYKFTITDSASNVLITYDNITGTNDIGNATGSLIASIVPSVTNTYNLGAPTFTWANAYVGAYSGTTITLTGAFSGNTLNLSGNASITGMLTQTGAATFSALSTMSSGATFGNVVRTGTTVFDWCEKGTFTPVLSFGGASTGITYTVQSGTFTRHGNVMFVSLTITLSSKGSATGAAQVAGLPYNPTVLSTGNFLPAASSTFASLSIPSCSTIIGSALLNLNNSNSTGYSVMTDANFTNSCSFFCTIVTWVA